MNAWEVMGVVCVAGGIGGLIHDLLACHGRRGKWLRLVSKWNTMAAGAVAAAISWGFYGPGSVVGDMGVHISLTPLMLTGAVLTGLGGVRWLNVEVAKRSQQDNPSSADEASQGRVRQMHQRGHAS
jgi:hypothetical protein